MRIVLALAAAFVGLLALLPLLLVATPLWLVSACTRMLAAWLEPPHVTHDQLIEFDAETGWKPRANVNTHHLMVDLFQISTDDQGWRGRSTLADSDVVVFGDSFAAGYGVGDKHVFANLSSQPRIKPIGIGGYSMVQELVWMRKLAGALRGKLVVWFIYVGNDLYDNLSPELNGYRKPFVREIGATNRWEICSSHVTRDRWPIVARSRNGHIHQAKLAELCCDTFLAQRAYRACEFLIEQGKQVCADAGADLVVFSVPDIFLLDRNGHEYLKSLGADPQTFDPDVPEKTIEALCRKLSVPFVGGRTFLDASCYNFTDGHWNIRGNRKVAEALKALHASRMNREQIAGATVQRGLPQHGRLGAVSQ